MTIGERTQTENCTGTNGLFRARMTAPPDTSPDDLFFGTAAWDASISVASGCATNKTRRVGRGGFASKGAIRVSPFDLFVSVSPSLRPVSAR